MSALGQSGHVKRTSSCPLYPRKVVAARIAVAIARIDYFKVKSSVNADRQFTYLKRGE